MSDYIVKRRNNNNPVSFNNFSFFFSPPTVVLLDTTKEDSLDWTRYPFGPQSATPGVSFDIFWKMH